MARGKIYEAMSEIESDQTQRNISNWNLHNDSLPTNYETWGNAIEKTMRAHKEQVLRVFGKIGRQEQ